MIDLIQQELEADDPYNRDDINERFAATAEDIRRFCEDEYEAEKREEAKAWWNAAHPSEAGVFPYNLVDLFDHHIAAGKVLREIARLRRIEAENAEEAVKAHEDPDYLPF